MGNSFTTSTASSPSRGTLTLITLRALVRQYSRNAGSSATYSDFDIDTAIASLCNRFLRMTKYLTRTDTLVASAGSTTLDVSSISTGETDILSFHPKRLIAAYPSTTDGSADPNTDRPLDILDYDRLLKQINLVRASGGIRCLAWSDPVTAAIYPYPSVDYNVTLKWWIPFTVFVCGTQGAYSSSITYYPGDVVANGGHTWQCKATATNVAPTAGNTWNDLGLNSLIAPASVSFTLPDDVLFEIAPCGIPAQLQHNQPEHKYASEARAKYLEIEASYMGAGSLDGNFNQSQPYSQHGDDGPHDRWPTVFGTGG